MSFELWDPFEDMKKLRKEMEKTFVNFWKETKPKLAKTLKVRSALVDVEDKKKEIVITAELPGIDKKDIKVSVKEDVVEIKAERKFEKEEKKKNYYRKERSYSGFYKKLTLPSPINPDKAKSSFKNGVLTITLPKLKQVKKKKILSLD